MTPELAPDSAGYLFQSALSLQSKRFWFQLRRPTVPLLFKLVGSDPERICWLQTFLWILGWGVLALVLARSLRSTPARLVAVVTVAVLSWSVVEWNVRILSDGPSLSLFALAVAALLLLAERPSVARISMATFAVIAWALARDSNVVLMALIALGFLGVSVWKRRPALAAASAVMLVVFVSGFVSMNQSGVWRPDLINVLSQRILPYPDRLAFFVAHGMPTGPDVLKYRNQFAWAFHPVSLGYADWEPWVTQSARPLMTRYWIAFPLQSLVDPLLYFLRNLDRWLPLLLAAALGVLLVASARGYRSLSMQGGLILLVLAIPSGFLSWHGDAIAVDRHCVGVVIQLQVAAILLGCAAVDALLDRRSQVISAGPAPRRSGGA